MYRVRATQREDDYVRFAKPLRAQATTRPQHLDDRIHCIGSLRWTNLDDAVGQVLERMEYAHPVFTPAGVAAQRRHGELLGDRDTSYVGAYWRNGFHEDGVVSALRACQRLGLDERLGRAA